MDYYFISGVLSGFVLVWSFQALIRLVKRWRTNKAKGKIDHLPSVMIDFTKNQTLDITVNFKGDCSNHLSMDPIPDDDFVIPEYLEE